MNYQKHYNSIVERGRQRSWTKKTAPVYVEVHHILPRCLGGSNEATNLVVLTAKEHFVSHLLLAKIHGGKLAYAALAMIHQKNEFQSRSYRITSTVYQNLKEQNAAAVSARMSAANKGVAKTQEHRNKIGDAHRGRSNCHKGVPKTQEHKDLCVKNRKLNGSTWHSSETKDKISLAISQIPKIVCPHCNTAQTPTNLKRWHLENCKSLAGNIRHLKD